MTAAPPSAFGSMMASGLAGAIASRSASVRPVCSPLTRTKRYGRVLAASASLRNAAALSRARALPSSAIESSRSMISASAPLVIALSSFLALSAGTKSSERIGFPSRLTLARIAHRHFGGVCQSMVMVVPGRHGLPLEGRRRHAKLRHDGDDDGAEHDFYQGVAPQSAEHMPCRSESCVRYKPWREPKS